MFVSVMTLLALGLAASILLAVASRVFHVQEDPRVEAVMEVLPGANCGGCGYAGCAGYAAAVVGDPQVPANKCCAGSAETGIAVGRLTGKAVAETEPLYALRRCDKLSGHAVEAYLYRGMHSCAAASRICADAVSCSFSCLGFGDCVRACPFNAMLTQNGLVYVDRDRCTGCGTCVAACPRGVLVLTPQRARVGVYCGTRNKGKAVTEVCGAGCIKCQRCIKACPAKAVSHTENRIIIDQRQCLAHGASCEEACVKSCPRHILRYARHAERPLPPGITDWKTAGTAAKAPGTAAPAQS